ncbi:NUDIX domain-containing protein [Candidatus Peregrinibacteria bacterium]|nr:NUDIX domain-containing protein [Candidatus Peregrinibacteria bacterium]
MKHENTKKTFSAGGVVLNKKGQILIVNQNGNSWSFPKGHIDQGENDLTAAMREIHEESGIKNLSFVKNLGTYSRYKIALQGGNDTSEIKNIHMFLFTTEEEKLSPLDPCNPEARWVEKTQVIDFLTHKKDQEFFLKIRKKIP